jgi:hypothetical protein
MFPKYLQNKIFRELRLILDDPMVTPQKNNIIILKMLANQNGIKLRILYHEEEISNPKTN